MHVFGCEPSCRVWNHLWRTGKGMFSDVFAPCKSKPSEVFRAPLLFARFPALVRCSSTDRSEEESQHTEQVDKEFDKHVLTQ